MLLGLGMSRRDTGDRFEMFLEELLCDCGFRCVRRNIVYTRWSRLRKKYLTRRQVDLEVREGILRRKSVFEAKYLTNGYRRSLPLNYRGQNLPQAVEEKRKFAEAARGYLVTNAYFTDDLVEEAKRLGIGLYDREELVEMDIRRGGDGKIGRKIRKMNLRDRGSSYSEKVYVLF